MQENKPLILIANDDGIFAKGIKELATFVKDLGEVVIVCPDKPQSGMGHAITINTHLRLNKRHVLDGIESYACTGTPVDSVKIGIYEILDRKPDIILSGINHGENISTNVLYSGTMSAAVEGAMEGIPSIGFSLADFDSDADFSHCKDLIRKIVLFTLQNKIHKGTCLNVNFPKNNGEPLKGLKVCRGAIAHWKDSFDKRLDQYGNPYYWLTGYFENTDKGIDTDYWAIHNGYASVVPIQFDMTAHFAINELNDWEIFQ